MSHESCAQLKNSLFIHEVNNKFVDCSKLRFFNLRNQDCSFTGYILILMFLNGRPQSFIIYLDNINMANLFLVSFEFILSLEIKSNLQPKGNFNNFSINNRFR